MNSERWAPHDAPEVQQLASELTLQAHNVRKLSAAHKKDFQFIVWILRQLAGKGKLAPREPKAVMVVPGLLGDRLRQDLVTQATILSQQTNANEPAVSRAPDIT